jgi:hypothetical protein
LTAPNCETLVSQLQSGEAEVVWGLLSVLPSVLTSRTRGQIFSSRELQSLVEACDLRLGSRLCPVPGAEAGCRMAELQVHGAVQGFRWKFEPHEIGCKEARHCVEVISESLSDLDPSWSPGRKLAIPLEAGPRRLRGDRRQFLPYDPVMAIIDRIPLMLYNAAQMCRCAAYEEGKITPDTEWLLKQRALLLQTEWRSIRSQRKGEQDWREGKKPHTFNLDLPKMLETENQALYEAARAAWDAGQYHTFPVLAHLYLWSAEDNQENRSFVSFFAKWIHQLGLEVPPPFANKSKAGAAARIQKACDDSPYWWRLRADQQADPNWRVILDRYEEWRHVLRTNAANPDPCYYDPFQLFKFLGFAMAEGRYSEPVVARSAFCLALRYGWTGLAEKFLGAFGATKKEVLDFCHHLKRIQQACPFGIDDAEDQHPAWRRVLKSAWRSLLGGPRLDAEESLVMHEVLVGRTVELVRWKGAGAAPPLLRKYSDLASEAEVREMVSAGGHAILPGVATIGPEGVLSLLRELSDSPLGRPVCASIVRLPGDRLSVLAVDQSCARGEDWKVCVKPFPGLGAEIQALNDTKDWLKIGNQDESEPPIDWGEQFTALCKFLGAQASSLNRSCGWLLLALEPDLAEFPWQDLVRRHWPAPEPPFVSLIPNFGWASRSKADLESFPKTTENLKNLSQHRDFSEFKIEIEKDLERNPAGVGSTAIFLGHGRREGDFTTIEAGTGPLRRESWLEIGEYQLVMVHSCSTGRVQGGFLGDLGGVPAIALAAGSRLVCAPVTEVPLRTARILHKWHFRPDVPTAFGCRYMRALAEDPWVGTYTCYGFGNQSVKGDL